MRFDPVYLVVSPQKKEQLRSLEPQLRIKQYRRRGGAMVVAVRYQ